MVESCVLWLLALQSRSIVLLIPVQSTVWVPGAHGARAHRAVMVVPNCVFTRLPPTQRMVEHFVSPILVTQGKGTATMILAPSPSPSQSQSRSRNRGTLSVRSRTQHRHQPSRLRPRRGSIAPPVCASAGSPTVPARLLPHHLEQIRCRSRCAAPRRLSRPRSLESRGAAAGQWETSGRCL